MLSANAFETISFTELIFDLQIKTVCSCLLNLEDIFLTNIVIDVIPKIAPSDPNDNLTGKPSKVMLVSVAEKLKTTD